MLNTRIICCIAVACCRGRGRWKFVSAARRGIRSSKLAQRGDVRDSSNCLPEIILERHGCVGWGERWQLFLVPATLVTAKYSGVMRDEKGREGAMARRIAVIKFVIFTCASFLHAVKHDVLDIFVTPRMPASHAYEVVLFQLSKVMWSETFGLGFLCLMWRLAFSN